MSGTLFSEYISQRSSLITEDRSLRREFLKTPSIKEIEADKVIRRIRAHEAATIWKEEHPSVPHPFPGMEFLTGILYFVMTLYFPESVASTGKSIIERTQLFKILCKVCCFPLHYGVDCILLRCPKALYYTLISMRQSMRPISSSLPSIIHACIFESGSTSPLQISSQTHLNLNRYQHIKSPKGAALAMRRMSCRLGFLWRARGTISRGNWAEGKVLTNGLLDQWWSIL